MFWAFETARFMAECGATLETTFDEDDVTHSRWHMENRKEAKFGAILASSPLKDSFRGLSPAIYRDNS